MTCVCRNKTRTLIVSGSENGTILLHRASVSSTRPLVVLCRGQGTEVCLHDSALNITLISLSLSCTRNLGLYQRISSVAFSQYETGMVASCGSSGTVKLWSVDSHRLLTTFSPSHSGHNTEIATLTHTHTYTHTWPTHNHRHTHTHTLNISMSCHKMRYTHSIELAVAGLIL